MPGQKSNYQSCTVEKFIWLLIRDPLCVLLRNDIKFRCHEEQDWALIIDMICIARVVIKECSHLIGTTLVPVIILLVLQITRLFVSRDQSIKNQIILWSVIYSPSHPSFPVLSFVSACLNGEKMLLSTISLRICCKSTVCIQPQP